MIKSKKDKLKLLLNKVRKKQALERRQIQDHYSGRFFEYSSLGRKPEKEPQVDRPIKEEQIVEKASEKTPRFQDYSLDLQPETGVAATTPREIAESKQKKIRNTFKNVLRGEPAYITPPTPEYTEPTLRQAEPKGFVDRALDIAKTPFVKSPEQKKADDWRIYATSKVRDISMPEAQAQIEQEKKEDFNRKTEIMMMLLGGTGIGVAKSIPGAFGTGELQRGLARMTIGKAAIGIASYMAIHGVKQAIIKEASNGTKKDFSDFLNDNTNEGTKQIAMLLELLVEGGLAGAIEKKALAPVIAKVKARFFPGKNLVVYGGDGTKNVEVLKGLVTDEIKKDLKVLGLEYGASRKQVEQVAREILHRIHPDKNQGKSKAQLEKLDKATKEINGILTRLRKNYRPEPSKIKTKDRRPGSTPEVQAQVKDLRALGLKWGVSRNDIYMKYQSLRQSGKLTPGQKKAFSRLMDDKKGYNPQAKATEFMRERKAQMRTKTAKEVEAELLTRDARNAISTAVDRQSGKSLPSKRPTTPALPVSVRRPEFPAVDTPKAEFQIVDPKKTKRLNSLLKDLEIARNKKQKVIDTGNIRGTTATKIKSDIAKINKTITTIQERITTARKGVIKTTGPVTPKSIKETTSPKSIKETASPKSIKETVNKVNEKATQTKIEASLDKKAPLKTYKSKTTDPIQSKSVKRATVKKAIKDGTKDVIKKKPFKTRKPKSYKQIAEEAREYRESKKKQSPAISRVLAGRTRESVSKAAAEKRVRPTVVKPKTPRKKVGNQELAKLKRDGADINTFAEKSRKAYLDFLEGKTKTDKSKEIDDFIADNFENESDAFYSRKAKIEGKPESRQLKKPTKRTIYGKLKSLVTRKKEWKLYEEMQRFVHKYAKLVSEKNVGRGAEGVYRKHSGNISVKSTNNMFAVSHEVAHAIASKLGIINKIINDKDLRTQKLLKDIFVKYYPTNKKLSLEDTLHESFAVLMEQYALQPKQITKEFPVLVSEFLKAGGKYTDKLILNAVKDMDKIVAKFLSLSAYEREAAKIVFDERYVKPSTIYTKVDEVVKQQVDYVRMMEKHAMVNKKDMTGDDPSVFFRLIQSVGRLALENIAGRKEYVSIDKNGVPKKMLDFTWRTLGEKIGDNGTYRDYNVYLYHRRLYHVNEKVKRLGKKQALTNEEKIDLEESKSILARSKFDEETTNAIVKERPKSFDKFDPDFDSLASMPVRDMMKTGLISNNFGNKLLKTKGYAKFARDMLDEVEGENVGTLFMSGDVTRPNPLKGKFKGSEKPTKDLFISTAKAGLTVHEQIMLQRTLQKMSKLESFGETEIISRRKIKPDETTFFPKIKGNKVEFRDGEEWVEMKISNELLDVFVTAKEMRSTDGLRKAAKLMSKTFIQGTTGFLYPAFAATNVFIDWVPAFAQSKNNLIPIVDGVKYYSLAVKGKLGKGNKYYDYWNNYKRSGGFNQTMINTFEENPAEILRDMRISSSKIHNELGIMQDNASAGLTYLTERSEALNRFAEYVKAMESGKPHAVAVEEAARVTGAFAHRGKMYNPTLRAWEESLVYANSTKQYIYSAIKAIADKDTRKKAVATHMIVGAITLLGFFKMVKELDEAKKSGDKGRIEKARALINEYMSQNSYGLSNNLYTIDSDLKNLTKVRVAGNYNDIGALLSMAFAEKMLDKEYSTKDYLKVVKDLYLPDQYDIFERNPGSITPQLTKPLVEIAFNKKTFPEKKDIIPKYLLRLPREKRYYPWTNDTAIWLADTPVMEMLDLSPIEIEHWMKGTGGRAIDVMTKYTDEGIIKSVGKGQAESFKKIVQNKTYMFTGVEYSQFYKDAEESATKYTELRKGQDRDAIMKQKGINDIYKGVSNQLRRIRKANNSDDVEVPIDVPNKIFDIVHALNTGKYRTAEKLYDRYERRINTFADRAEDIITR